MTVVRTRDREAQAAADLRIDVGFSYDPARGDFDHHQRGFDETRPNGVRYASFGLIWREHGARLCGGDQEVAEAVDATLVAPVDANDTGQQLAETLIDGVRPMGVSGIIGGFNSAWDGTRTPEADRAGFDAAVVLAVGVLEREIASAAAGQRAVRIIRAAIDRRRRPARGRAAGQRALEVRAGPGGARRALRDLPEAPGLRPRGGPARAGRLRHPPPAAGGLGRAGGRRHWWRRPASTTWSSATPSAFSPSPAPTPRSSNSPPARSTGDSLRR